MVVKEFTAIENAEADFSFVELAALKSRLQFISGKKKVKTNFWHWEKQELNVSVRIVNSKGKYALPTEWTRAKMH